MAADHKWRHDALAVDLARKLRNDGKAWTWLNATIGAWSGPRPDIMAFPRYRYDLPQIHAYEIKVSRADMLSDLNSDKWRKYLEHCQSVTFAMPHGIATKDDIPPECGVMFRTGRGWRTERRARNLGTPCSIQAMAKLLTCHPTVERDREGWARHESNWAYQARTAFLQKHGSAISSAVAQLAATMAEGKDPAADAREKAAKIIADGRAEADAMLAEIKPLLDFLGIGPRAGYWTVRNKIEELKCNLQVDSRIARVEHALKSAQDALAKASTEIGAQ